MTGFPVSLAIATILGFLAGMGTGGGSLLLLWLTQVVMLEHAQARIINLLFYLPAALIATLFRKKQRSIDGKTAWIAAVSGCCAAVIFSMISQIVDVTVLKKLLGVLLVVTGLREIFYRPRKAR